MIYLLLPHEWGILAGRAARQTHSIEDFLVGGQLKVLGVFEVRVLCDAIKGGSVQFGDNFKISVSSAI